MDFAVCPLAEEEEEDRFPLYLLHHTCHLLKSLGLEGLNMIADLSSEADQAKKPRTARGTYAVYTPENHALIGK